MVHVIRANHLPSEGNRVVEPYVKMYLLPERRNHCKTRICKKSLDPEFNEMFSFDVPFNNLANRMLQFTVYDFDRFTRHDLIGNVIMRVTSSTNPICATGQNIRCKLLAVRCVTTVTKNPCTLIPLCF
uniref:Synaptotagmin-C n=1 Tax=Ascaris suum TaxID=6253 RepID=F1LEY1_ASCSU